VKVALVCPTVGQTRRGYERFMTDLFGLIRGEVDATLFKGGGEPAPGECVVPHMRRTGLVARMAGDRLREARMRVEFATFAAALWPHLRRGRFDVVHAIDPALAPKLARMRRLVRPKYGFVFTDGGPDPFDATPYADVVHYVTPQQQQEALARGAIADKGSVIPVGVNASAAASASERAALRGRYGVGPATFVILSVTSLNRHHKRVDHLVEEVARLPGDVLLWIDASTHPDGDASLLEMARERLGARFRHTHVASDQVAELYRLADVLVSASLHETFGMSLVEASCAGLPVMAHDAPHFRWLLEGHGHLVDMAASGVLAGMLARFRDHPEELAKPGGSESARRRFGWDSLKPGYLDLYRQAMERAS
jgi:glycosyltransferase involved in cell wall biosynthesis